MRDSECSHIHVAEAVGDSWLSSVLLVKAYQRCYMYVGRGMTELTIVSNTVAFLSPSLPYMQNWILEFETYYYDNGEIWYGYRYVDKLD